MTNATHVHELYHRGDYTEALTTAWALPRRYSYLSDLHRGDMDLRDLVFCACRQAVREEMLAWITERLASFPPPAALIGVSSDDEERSDVVGPDWGESYRTEMIRIYLYCALVACWSKRQAPKEPTAQRSLHVSRQAEETLRESMASISLPDDVSAALDALTTALNADSHWPSLALTVPVLADIGLERVIQPRTALPQHPGPLGLPPRELTAPLGLLRDLTAELLDSPLRRAERSRSLIALLVNTRAEKGVVADLTLEMMADGSGKLYPLPALAFLPNQVFHQAAEAARTYVDQEKHLWQADRDVRWRLEPRDTPARPAALVGDSAGGAFALGTATLFAGE